MPMISLAPPSQWVDNRKGHAIYLPNSLSWIIFAIVNITISWWVKPHCPLNPLNKISARLGDNGLFPSKVPTLAKQTEMFQYNLIAPKVSNVLICSTLCRLPPRLVFGVWTLFLPGRVNCNLHTNANTIWHPYIALIHIKVGRYYHIIWAQNL